MIAEPNRNRRASKSLSPTLTLFLAPYGKLYLRLQDHGRESVNGRPVGPPSPETLASSMPRPLAL